MAWGGERQRGTRSESNAKSISTKKKKKTGSNEQLIYREAEVFSDSVQNKLVARIQRGSRFERDDLGLWRTNGVEAGIVAGWLRGGKPIEAAPIVHPLFLPR